MMPDRPEDVAARLEVLEAERDLAKINLRRLEELQANLEAEIEQLKRIMEQDDELHHIGRPDDCGG